MHKNSPHITILVVTKTKTVTGELIKLHTIKGETLPYRVFKRHMPAYNAGLEYVRSLGAPKPLTMDAMGVIAVTVTDGKRAYASWRRMDDLDGFTGTHDIHPLIEMAGIKK